MSVSVLPFVGSIANYDFTTTIGASTYTFTVSWNYREDSWYFDVDDANGSNLISSVKLCLGAFLGRTTPASPFTDGVMIAVDTAATHGGDAHEAGFDDLGTRVIIKYFEAADWIALFMDTGDQATQ